VIEIALNVTAKLIVVLVFGADDVTRPAFIAGRDAAHENTVVPLE
jgi:hypothetical protein